MSSTNFINTAPTLDNYWRSIILFGRNVASYKFALAKSLLDLGENTGGVVRLDELAVPFSRHVCEHLLNEKKQTTSTSSRFLEACERFNSGEITQDELTDNTVRLGFNNVIDAFHNVNQQELPLRFFRDERQTGEIRLTDEFYKLQSAGKSRDLSSEVESRWRLVETAWALKVSRNVIAVGYDNEAKALFSRVQGRRKAITSCRGALNGYQKGSCFYCSSPISILAGDDALADVDHFFPHVLSSLNEAFYGVINGVWNLVLACAECNRGTAGKWTQIPHITLLERLHVRNEYLISSHHPLRETIIAQTGATETNRRDFLQAKHTIARSTLIRTWQPSHYLNPVL